MKIKVGSLDTLATQAVRVREKNICQRCQKLVVGRNSHCAHIRPRVHKQTRWYMPNLLHLCFYCHRWAHSDPLMFTEWVKGKIGEEMFLQLQIMSNETWDKDTFKWKVYLQDFIKQEETNGR